MAQSTRGKAWLSIAIGLAICFSSISQAQAKWVHFGLGLGANYSSYLDAARNGDLAFVTPSGWGFTGSAGMSFFQDWILGFRTGLDVTTMSLSESGSYLDATVLFASFVPSVNFNLFGNRHSLGFGAAYASALKRKSNRSAGQSNFLSAVIEGRDMWKLGKDRYFFLSAKVFLLDTSANVVDTLLALTIGVDF